MAGTRGRRGFGWVRKLPSKRWQASYIGPDGLRHNAPATFTTKGDAEGWLSAESRLVAADDWRAPTERPATRKATRVTLADYAETWLRERELKPRTRALYRDLLDRHIVPTLGALTVDLLTPADTTTPAGEMVANVILSTAQYERRLIGERTKAGLASARAKGIRLGRPQTLPSEIVARIVAERRARASLPKIAAGLIADAVQTAQGGATWHASTVAAVLKSQAAAELAA